MGNDHSQLSGLELEEKAVEVTDFWAHHSATVNSGNVTNLSVFIGEPLVGGSLWVSQTPLEKAAKNLMIHRHPSILKYISSWNKGSKFYLAVENVKPLSHVLANQNTLQICIGLHSILKALHFLHEKASASHNNICTASIYVTKDGNWKLGGMEYLCRFQDMSAEYMSKTRSHRYQKSIDPNEEKYLQNSTINKNFVDIYAFSVLAKEVLKNKSDDEIPSVSLFRYLCKNSLQNDNVDKRSALDTLLEHPFFNHEFISIHSFLTELPLKNDLEKAEFFSHLRTNLKHFDGEIVGSQLGGLLLSRMVLLNKTAQTELLPFVLCPSEGPLTDDNGMFSTDNFKKFITPRLLDIFCVRDAQIRLLLLDHFVQYVHMFSREELQTHILPELLVGIKDTNDHLVAVTLRALADLVPILGAATVIGGKRAKLFNDGRPITHGSKRSQRNSKRSQEITPTVGSISTLTIDDVISGNSSTAESHQILELPERPSPDGEEGETSTEEIEQSVDDDLANWEDWDINDENSPSNANTLQTGLSVSNMDSPQSTSVDDSETNIETSESQSNTIQNIQLSVNTLTVSNNKKSLPDITELDIKNQRNSSAADLDHFDFFQDMEPVIETTTKFLITDSIAISSNDSNKEVDSKKLDLSVKEIENHEEGWVEEDW